MDTDEHGWKGIFSHTTLSPGDEFGQDGGNSLLFCFHPCPSVFIRGLIAW